MICDWVTNTCEQRRMESCRCNLELHRAFEARQSHSFFRPILMRMFDGVGEQKPLRRGRRGCDPANASGNGAVLQMGGEAPPNEVGGDAEKDSAACGEERRKRLESMAGGGRGGLQPSEIASFALPLSACAASASWLARRGGCR